MPILSEQLSCLRAPLDAASLGAMLAAYRFNFVTERDLQDGIAEVLTAAGISFHRELALSQPDRPDFLVNDVAIEVKIKGSIADLLRQVTRYAAHDDVQSILVVGTPHWLSRVPTSIASKPVTAVRFIGSLL